MVQVPRFDRLDCCGRVCHLGAKCFKRWKLQGLYGRMIILSSDQKTLFFLSMLHRDYDFRHAFLYDPNPFPWNVTGCHWVTSYFSSQVRWFGETNRCFSTIPKCQDTKRAIGIYEALNDKKGEAGYLQVLHVSGVGFGGSLHTVFFGSPSIGKRRFFPA